MVLWVSLVTSWFGAWWCCITKHTFKMSYCRQGPRCGLMQPCMQRVIKCYKACRGQGEFDRTSWHADHDKILSRAIVLIFDEFSLYRISKDCFCLRDQVSWSWGAFEASPSTWTFPCHSEWTGPGAPRGPLRAGGVTVQPSSKYSQPKQPKPNRLKHHHFVSIISGLTTSSNNKENYIGFNIQFKHMFL